MWREDDWFQELPVDGRLLWIYLFTNPSASAAGIYRLPLRTIAFECGLTPDRTLELLDQFGAANKAHYCDGVVWVVKMRKLQFPGGVNDKIMKRIDSDVALIPDCELKIAYLRYYSPDDTLSIPYPYPTEQEKQETETVTVTDRVTKQEPERAAADLTDDVIDTFRKQYENLLGIMGTAVYPDARDYMAKLHARNVDDWWLMALRETVNHANRPGWHYMKSVLESWLAAGAPATGKDTRINGKSTSLGLQRSANDPGSRQPTAAEQAEWDRAVAEMELRNQDLPA